METIEIEFKGLRLRVEFNYEAGDEGRRYYPDGSGQPPTPPNVEIEVLEWVNEEGEYFDCFDIFEALGHLEEVAEKVIWRKEE